MTDFSKLTPEQLEKMDKQVLITIIGALQNTFHLLFFQFIFTVPIIFYKQNIVLYIEFD